jgi:hypothetical protein
VTDDTGPALPRRTATPHTPAAPRTPPDIQTLRRVADALRELPGPQQQARAAARIRAARRPAAPSPDPSPRTPRDRPSQP